MHAQATQRWQQARLSRDKRFDGTFFVAVRTTGIFCRPICPVQLPKEENVTYYPLAQQAMEAGYRPCLRCRPDSAPMSWAWQGVDTTVARGLKLLQQFPDLSLQEIADKLGVTDRYFRALFKRKLGVGPKRFQLYEQLLFAKQLLHQSDLSIEQIAQASGFSSARRLQENMKKTLKLSPSQIRRQSSEHAEHIQVRLAYRAPYQWEQVRGFLARRAIDGVEEVAENRYARQIRVGEELGWFAATHNPEQQAFDIQVSLPSMTSFKSVIGEIRRLLDLDADPALIGQALQQTGLSNAQVRQGLRIPGIWSAFEAGCRAVLGQQISVTAAINLVTKLTHELGERVDGRLYFPDAASVANSDLAFLGMPQARRDTLRRLAKWCAEHPGETDLSQWLSLKGIGPWTVAYAQMRGQSQPDVWLNTDLVIKKQLQQHALDAEQAAPWRSYLTFQLWSMA